MGRRCGTCAHFKLWDEQPNEKHTQQLRKMREIGDCLYSCIPDSVYVEENGPMESTAGKNCPCWEVRPAAPVTAGGPVLFVCCDPCASGICGRPECDHGALDENEFANATDALDLLHEGCLCFVVSKEEIDAKDR